MVGDCLTAGHLPGAESPAGQRRVPDCQGADAAANYALRAVVLL